MLRQTLQFAFGSWRPVDAGHFGGWEPPPNPVIAASVGLAISTCIAIRLILDVSKSGNLAGIWVAGRDVFGAVALLASQIRGA